MVEADNCEAPVVNKPPCVAPVQLLWSARLYGFDYFSLRLLVDSHEILIHPNIFD